MNRFYKVVAAIERPEGWTIELDGRPVKTPAKTLLAVPHAPLAHAIAQEWSAQVEKIDPNAMPLTRHANTALDRVAPQREHVIDEIAAYGASDLVCYLAEGPPALVAREMAEWQPLHDWLSARYDIRLVLTEGIGHVAQPPEALARLKAAVAAHGDLALAGLHTVTTLLGSLVIALALAGRRLDAEGAWRASRVDEEFQIERWGEDAEAVKRARNMRFELAAAAVVLDLSTD